MTWFETYWLVVTLVVFLLLFLPVEILAIRDGVPGGTLSETVWRLLYPKPVDRHYRYRRWIRIALAAGLGWLCIHLLTRGWF